MVEKDLRITNIVELGLEISRVDEKLNNLPSTPETYAEYKELMEYREVLLSAQAERRRLYRLAKGGYSD